MARVVVIGPNYRRSFVTVGFRFGSKASLAVGRAIRELADAAELPEADARGLVPNVDGEGVSTWAEAWWISEAGLWLWYRADERSVTLIALSR
ncbi:MAG TPA: hypothetical protein VF395_12855 [Polyangiaceae bacterium]